MGILDIFFGQKNNKEKTEYAKPPVVNFNDERKAECPYCNKALKKIPGSKTKCPHCGHFMFVRTRFKDRIRIVVTKKDADEIDEDRMIMGGASDNFEMDKEEFEKEKNILYKQSGKEPSEKDIKWALMNKALLKHMRVGDWGLYRCVRSDMAGILCQEMRFKEAMQTYFEVCYWDMNGPRNMGGNYDPEILKDFPEFDPKELGFLSPGHVDTIRLIAKKLRLDHDEVKLLFIEHNSRLQKRLKLPLSTEDAWIIFNAEYQKQNR